MKRILPLILTLVAGMAQADSNSDYRAGSDFAHQIKGQGSSTIKGFKPQESIPGYNANPDETKYYGGVTAGGDGGLKNDGTTEWATGETGKTITESFMNKPKDILSPDAPFIQTGRDVVNRAEMSIMGSGQGAKKKKQVFAALRAKCPAIIQWAITDEVLDAVIERAFAAMTAALSTKKA